MLFLVADEIAGPFEAEVGSFRLHLAAEGKSGRTIHTYIEAVSWFAAAYLLGETRPRTGGSRWTGRMCSGGWCGSWAGTVPLTPATSPCGAAVPQVAGC